MRNFSWSRRAFLGAGLLAPAALLADSGDRPRPVTMATPMRSANLRATVGVNTHLRYAKSQYDDIEAVLSALSYCHLHHVRDTAISAQAPNASHYGRLAAAGIRSCMYWGNGRPMSDAIAQISALESAHPGAVEFLEGPNEIQPRFAYAGLTGLAAGQKFMADMKAEASADPHLNDKPLVSFTSFRPASSVADFANHHPYPKAGSQPGDLIRSRLNQWVGSGGAMPGKPMVLTEFGYHTLVGKPVNPAHWQGVDEEVQAILTLNGLLDAAAAGIARTYIYQLLDGAADSPDHVSQENHFGLFRADGEPKPAATAIRNLMNLVSDPSSGQHEFPLAPIALRLTSERPVNALPLQDAGGQHSVVLWREVPIWDVESAARITVSDVAVQLEVPPRSRISAVSIAENRPVAASLTGRTASLPLNAAPILIRFS